MAICSIFSLPILVVETQMGAPATQIIMNEVLSDQLTGLEYRVGKSRFSFPHKVVIRVGTSGGINCVARRPLNIGDIVVATHSIGVSGANIQSNLRVDYWRPGAFDQFSKSWTSLGKGFTITQGGHPKVECSDDVRTALETAGRSVAKQACHLGGNISKDSLYAELSTETFLELCRTENCRTTEMELSALAVAASEHNAHFGMVSAIVGLLPGVSFVESEKEMAIGEQRLLRVSLEAVKYFRP
jgi:uridine phosphorylase